MFRFVSEGANVEVSAEESTMNAAVFSVQTEQHASGCVGFLTLGLPVMAYLFRHKQKKVQ